VTPPLAFRRIQLIDRREAQAHQNLIDAISKFAAKPFSESGDATPFMLRKSEFGQAVAHLEDAIEGQGGFMLLSGEAGVGKTRVVLESAKSARQKGVLVLSSHCMGTDGAPPYQPLLEQIESAIRLTSAENLRISRGENASEVAKLVPELHQIYHDIEQSVALPPEQERRYLLHGVGEFVVRASVTQPLLLIFEDIHLADDSTGILVRHLAQRLKDSQVLMLGTYRDTELDSHAPFKQALQELNRERLVDDIPRKRFDRNGVKAMLEARVRKAAPEQLIDPVYSETEGNPFFVEEVFRHLMESEKLLDESGEFAPGIQIADTEVPRGVRLIMTARIERVSKTC
jgi:predicted ATPase